MLEALEALKVIVFGRKHVRLQLHACLIKRLGRSVWLFFAVRTHADRVCQCAGWTFALGNMGLASQVCAHLLAAQRQQVCVGWAQPVRALRAALRASLQRTFTATLRISPLEYGTRTL